MELWNIQQLAAALAAVLEQTGPPEQQSGRVREVPDTRTIRYYTTLGLVDRPAEMRGRTAFYEPKHLLQLLAIKRLQAAGRTLVEVQQQLTGATLATLQQVAALPAELWEQIVAGEWSPGEVAPEKEAPESRIALPERDAFWSAEPLASRAPAPRVAAPATPRPVPVAQPQWVLPLAPGVDLVLHGTAARGLTAADWQQLAPAIEQLTKQLAQLGWQSSAPTAATAAELESLLAQRPPVERTGP